MIVNTTNRPPAPHLVFIALCSLILLASCSAGDENETADITDSVERQPEQIEEAANSIESRPELIEEIVVSRPEPELRLESAAEIERHLDYSGLSASSAVSSSGQALLAMGSAGSRAAMADNTHRADEYNVVLGVDETIKIPGLPGELRVWIGSPDYRPEFPERMSQDEATVPALGESAKVQPFAPAFTIEPAETQCIRIHPSGSEVRFKLIPQKQGSFEVGANVYLFDSLDCSGSPIPKTAATLKVRVEVDSKQAFIEKLNELWHVLWQKFVEFWAALLAVLFGLILFLIRGRLKHWFGYDDK